MRSGIIGFVLGVVLCLLAVAVVRQLALREVEYEFTAHFASYVFSGTEFPPGDFEMDRTVHRLLFPTRFSVTFYNAHNEQVQHADQPGRYGAVVTMKVGTDTLHRFVTLYRTPTKIYWPGVSWPISGQIPPEIGLDPLFLRDRAPQIDDVLRYALVGQGDTSRDLAILLAGLSEMSTSAPSLITRTDVVARDDAWWEGLRETLGLATRYPFWVDLPHDYDADPGKRWPLIFYLTTGAENGTNLLRVRQSSLGILLQAGKQIPAVVVSPQCPLNEEWNSKALSRLLDQVSAQYRIDPDRIYLTGGGETWTLAMVYPDRFAAMVPIDGETDPAAAARLKGVPVWAFHGAGDEVTPIARTTDMLDAIRNAGGQTHLTITKGRGDVWDEVYATNAIYSWLLAQKRGQPEVITPGVPMP